MPTVELTNERDRRLLDPDAVERRAVELVVAIATVSVGLRERGGRVRP